MLTLEEISIYPNRGVIAHSVNKQNMLYFTDSLLASNVPFLRIYQSMDPEKVSMNSNMSFVEVCGWECFNTTGDSKILGLTISRKSMPDNIDKINQEFSEGYRYPRLNEILNNSAYHLMHQYASYPQCVNTAVIEMWVRKRKLFPKSLLVKDVLAIDGAASRSYIDRLYTYVENRNYQGIMDMVSRGRIKYQLIDYSKIPDGDTLLLITGNQLTPDYNVLMGILDSGKSNLLREHYRQFPSLFELDQYPQYLELQSRNNPSVLYASMMNDIVERMIHNGLAQYVQVFSEKLDNLYHKTVAREKLTFYVKKWYADAVRYNSLKYIDELLLPLNITDGRSTAMYLTGDINLVKSTNAPETITAMSFAAESGSVEVLKYSLRDKKLNPYILSMLYESSVLATDRHVSDYIKSLGQQITIDRVKISIKYAIKNDGAYRIVDMDRLKRIFEVDGTDEGYTPLFEALTRETNDSYLPMETILPKIDKHNIGWLEVVNVTNITHNYIIRKWISMNV